MKTAEDELLEVARQIIAGEVGLIEGVRVIVRLQSEIGAGRLDEDFVPFVAVDSETDSLPIGSARELWDSKALLSQDAEINKAEAIYSKTIRDACKKLIVRFDV